VENCASVSFGKATFPFRHTARTRGLFQTHSRENLFQTGEAPLSLSFCEVFVSTIAYFVRDIMSQPAITVEASTFLLDAALMLRADSIRHLLVVKEGHLVGLLTDRDIQRCAPSRLIPISEEGYNAVFAGTTVDRVMTREPLSVPPDMPLEAAISTMQQSRIGCLAVVENEVVVGILTRSDLVDALQRLLAGKSARRNAELA